MELIPGFIPFWFWNDRLTRPEIEFQIKEMVDKGIKGFFIHPRQGLQQPYLSEAFFKMIDFAVEKAEQYGVIVNLYDEYPYPTGIAGGEVVLGNPEFYATELEQEVKIVKGGEIRLELPRGKVLSARAFPVKNDRVLWDKGIDLRDFIGMVLTEDSYVEMGLTSYNRKRYFASNPRPVLEVELDGEEYKIYISVQRVIEKFKYWNNYVDILNGEAVKTFMEYTHERYRKRYGDKFGKSILSIFSDEVGVSWSSKIPAAFQSKYGYNLDEKLPALQDTSHPEHLKVKNDLYRLQYEMFCGSFEKSISDWCKKNNLLYAGEKPSQRLAQLRYMDIPGCDPGHIKAGAKFDMLRPQIRRNAKSTASAAYFYDKRGALCECYHSTGWSATLQDAKLIAEGLLLLGIKYLVPHGFFYSTHALKKNDSPPSFFFQMPYWPLFSKLSERIEKINQLFAGTHIDAKVLVIDPASGLPDGKDLENYQKLQFTLMENHIDFLTADTDILEEGEILDGFLEIKDLIINLIIVPSMKIIEKPLQDFLINFEERAGKVIYLNNIKSDSLTTNIEKVVRPALRIQENGEEIHEVWVVKRVSEERTLWFILNTGTKKYNADIIVDKGVNLKEIELEEGICFLNKEGDIYKRIINPFESFVIDVSNEVATLEISNKSSDRKKLPLIKMPIRGELKLKPRDKNLLRMYHWEMSILGRDGTALNTAEVRALPLSNQLEEGGFYFTPGVKQYFGHQPDLEFPQLDLLYEFSFENNYLGLVNLILEPGSIRGDEWWIKINDSGKIGETDFHYEEKPIRANLGKDVTSLLVRGKNIVQVRIKASRANHGLQNPLFLMGDFGVSLNPVGLVEQKNIGYFENYNENLLPFYSGILDYNTTIYLDNIPTSGIIFDMQFNDFHQATEVTINESDPYPVLWEPRIMGIPAETLKVGVNKLNIRVYTTRIRSFEGKWFDYKNHIYREL